MKILLIAPHRLERLKDSKGTLPVPLLHLAAVLREKGHQVVIYDFSTKGSDKQQWDHASLFHHIDELVADTAPELVGINCFTTLHFPFSQVVCQAIKATDKTLPVVIGGAHPSLFAREILENEPTVDLVVLGEGERQMVAIADAFPDMDSGTLHRIPGIAYRNANGNTVVTERKHYINDLDALPFPAWDLIDISEYYADHSTWYNPKGLEFQTCIPILTSRSCPFKCNFCACHATMGRKFRKRKPQRVVDEIQMLHELNGQNYFGFIDDNINLDEKHIIEICDEIVKRNLNIQYETTCGVHIASLNEEIVHAMADSGCVFVRLPVEHGNDYIRNTIIGKKLSRDKIFLAAQNLKQRNIFTSSMFIMGFPEDTSETLDDTYKMICDLELDLNYVFNLIPFPGTRVFQQAVEDGLLIADYGVDDLWKGTISLDPVQDECTFFLKPYRMSLQELSHYRDLFDSLQFYSQQAKEHNKVGLIAAT